MSRYTFDGFELRDRGRVIATVQGNRIQSRRDYRLSYEIRNGRVVERATGEVVFTIAANSIYEGATGRRVGSMSQVHRQIPEPDSMVKAALWACFVRGGW